MNYITYYNLKPGDRIVTPKSFFGMIQHHAIYLGQNYYGQDLIAENAYGKYVQIVTAENFFLEYPEVTRIIRFKGNGNDREVAVKRALDQLGKPYSLINFNCEHFANLVQFNIARSAQVSVGLLLLLVVAIIVNR